MSNNNKLNKNNYYGNYKMNNNINNINNKNNNYTSYTPRQIVNYNNFIKLLDNASKNNNTNSKNKYYYYNLNNSNFNGYLVNEIKYQDSDKCKTNNKVLNFKKENVLVGDNSCHNIDNKKVREKDGLSNIFSKKRETKDFKQRVNFLEINSPNENNETTVNYTEEIVINRLINNIDDLLYIINNYQYKPTIKYNINLKALHSIKQPLEELNAMIGLKELKQSLVYQLLYFIQNLHLNNEIINETNNETNNEINNETNNEINNETNKNINFTNKLKKTKIIKSDDYLHSVLYGPPGTGKTEIAKLIGRIYSSLGILSKNIFKKVTRSDLVAGYLGQTALKTKEVINECIGGVLFIDEAYSLGNPDKKDSFSKECIDTLCEALSDNKDNLMVIIAGYEKELKESFFNYNSGLDSRFTWRFFINNYNGSELASIFIKKVNDCGWSLDINIITDISEKIEPKIEPKIVKNIDTHNLNNWFEKNIEYFPYYGRDIENLLFKIKIVHSKRIFCAPLNEKKIINYDDLEEGFKLYKSNDFINEKIKNDKFKKDLLNTLYY